MAIDSFKNLRLLRASFALMVLSPEVLCVATIPSFGELRQSDCASNQTIDPPGPWSDILENWTLSENLNGSRTSRVMKLGDNTVIRGSTTKKRDVSETDLYLLGAIEKLVYRVDFLEKRLRRAEELLYYVIAGNNGVKEPCASNYTRIGPNCYYFSEREFDWKSASSLCRGMGGHLAEFETIEENQDIVSHLHKDNKLRGKNFWTGGLNPGLLWIWATSARPVHKDTKQAVIGDGRCLKMNYESNSRIYAYKGEECSSRQKYICELARDDDAANKVENSARSLVDNND